MALLSAVLLVLSFPNFNQWWCAWFALVPWLLLIRTCAPREALRWSFLIGMVFFLASLWWLIHVTFFGWIGLCVIMAAYFALFGWSLAWLRVIPSGVSLLLVPAIWVAMEFLRSRLFSGFGWNALSYSQTPWPGLIQFADVTGAWGISFVIVLVNSALASLADRDLPKSAALRNLVMAGCVLLAAAAYGAWRMPQVSTASSVRIALVQGNIPQNQKWDAVYQATIFERYTTLTKAAAATQPDLIIWPETSVPGYFNVDEDVTQWVFGLAKEMQRPLLVGAPIPTIHEFRVLLQNAAALVNPAGDIAQRYAKIHLVPFGEYVPFEHLLPFLRAVTPPSIGMFTPGKDYTVFTIDSAGQGARGEGRGTTEPTPHVSRPVPPFSVLICFEDLFPDLARRFIQRGARMLVVITNDAWFGPTAAAYQHAQASMLRAVELRVPVVRAGNTGWSGCLDAAGRTLGSVRNAQGQELFIEGTHTCEVPLGPDQPSVYLRWGDWFALVCLLVSALWLGLQRITQNSLSSS